MTNASKDAKEAALIVFGRPNETRAPRAAWFRAEDSEGARCAALDMDLVAFTLETDEARAIAVEIPEGRFSTNGKAQIPTIALPLYERLAALNSPQVRPASQPETDEDSPTPENEPHLPQDDVHLTLSRSSEPSASEPPAGELLEIKRQILANSSPLPDTSENRNMGLPVEAIVPAILVFGRSGLGRARAGWFTRIEAVLARKAADAVGFRWIEVQTKEQHLAAAELSHGRLSGNGILTLRTVLMSIFEHLNRVALRAPDQAAIFYEAPAAQAAPTNWDDVLVGNVVLAVDGASGWWEAIVLNRMGQELALAWQVEPEEPIFTRTIFEIALPHPSSDRVMSPDI
ncbi:MAG TPA: hypothetical protein VHV77_13150 [Pirellulales bacterium]|nr:hypothetical protein [Pirellulales bacterium]